VTGPASVVYDARLTDYDFGAGHPLAPVRIDLTMRLARSLGLLDREGVRLVDPPVATEQQLELVHTSTYIEAVKRLSGPAGGTDLEHGLGTADNPTFVGMHSAAASVAGASIEAARAVWSGEAVHAVNVSGGLHHAMAGYASGFCVYNDPALAVAWLLQQGAERVAYVDVDVHHGDGVQAAFYDDARVLTLSLHESPRTLFPGTGAATEVGGPNALGYAGNVALPAGTADAGWLRAFFAVVPPLLREFRPDVLVTQHGCDTHRDDPLAHLMLTVDGQRAAVLALHDLSHELCGGRWVAVGGGGYAVVSVVPRSWAHLLAIATGSPLDPRAAIPADWREYARATTGRSAPGHMTDGDAAHYRDWSAGYNPDSDLDRSISASRQALFPLHGLHLTH
jgi:acetoin utilization protein AcuC